MAALISWIFLLGRECSVIILVSEHDLQSEGQTSETRALGTEVTVLKAHLHDAEHQIIHQKNS